MIGAIILFASIIGLTYVWGLNYPGKYWYIFMKDINTFSSIDGKKIDDFLYRPTDKSCYQSDAVLPAYRCLLQQGACAIRIGNNLVCGRYNNETKACA